MMASCGSWQLKAVWVVVDNGQRWIMAHGAGWWRLLLVCSGCGNDHWQTRRWRWRWRRRQRGNSRRLATEAVALAMATAMAML